MNVKKERKKTEMNNKTKGSLYFIYYFHCFFCLHENVAILPLLPPALLYLVLVDLLVNCPGR